MTTKKEVEHIAKLARIKLTKREIEKMQKELSKILDYFEILKQADTKNIEPFLYPAELRNVLRDDEEIKFPQKGRETILTQAPKGEKGYFKVKEILK